MKNSDIHIYTSGIIHSRKQIITKIFTTLYILRSQMHTHWIMQKICRWKAVCSKVHYHNQPRTLLQIYNASLNHLICVFLEQLSMPAVTSDSWKDAGLTTSWTMD